MLDKMTTEDLAALGRKLQSRGLMLMSTSNPLKKDKAEYVERANIKKAPGEANLDVDNKLDIADNMSYDSGRP